MTGPKCRHVLQSNYTLFNFPQLSNCTWTKKNLRQPRRQQKYSTSDREYPASGKQKGACMVLVELQAIVLESDLPTCPGDGPGTVVLFLESFIRNSPRATVGAAICPYERKILLLGNDACNKATISVGTEPARVPHKLSAGLAA